MKKFLALVLALVMTMSLVTISAGAEDFTDAADITYKEAVDVMTAVKVVDGYTDGSFNPTAGLTRGAAAKIICNLILGPTTASALVADAAPYSDVPTTNGFAGYIAFCKEQGIISGYADGTFKPANGLTGYAFMKMLLGALGYDASVEGYTGDNWSIAVAKRALNIGLDNGLKNSFTGVKQVTREEALLYAFNTMKADMVEYDTTITIGDVTIAGSKAAVIENKAKTEGIANDDVLQFAEKYFNKLSVKEVRDAFGRPANEWKNGVKKVGTYVWDADLEYTAPVSLGTIYADLGLSKATATDEYAIDGKDTADINLSKGLTTKIGGNGILTQVWFDNEADELIITQVETYVGKVASVTKATATANRYITLSKYNRVPNGTLNTKFETENFAAKDLVTYTAAYNATTGKYDIKSVAALTEKVTGTLTAWNGYNHVSGAGQSENTFTVDGVVYKYSNNYAIMKSSTSEGEIYDFAVNKTDVNVYVDEYGYALYVDGVAAPKNYATLIGYGLTNQYGSETRGATLLFPDGTTKEVTAKLASNGVWGTANTASNLVNEEIGDLVTYTVDDNGVYTLTVVAPYDETYDDAATEVTFVNGKSLFLLDDDANATGKDKTLYTTSETVFFVCTDGTNGAKNYKVYTGYNAMPSIDAVNNGEVGIAYVTDATYTSQINYVYIYAKALSGSAGVDTYFVKPTKADIITDSTGSYYVLPAIEKGEETVVKVSCKIADVDDNVNEYGLFAITGVVKDSNGIITSFTKANTTTFNAANGTSGVVAANEVVLGIGSTIGGATYWAYTDETKVYSVDKDYKTISVSAIDAISTDANDKVFASKDTQTKVLKDVVVVEVSDDVVVAPEAPTSPVYNGVSVVVDGDDIYTDANGKDALVEAQAIEAALAAKGYTNIFVEVDGGAVKDTITAKIGNISVAFNLNPATTTAVAANSTSLNAAIASGKDTVYLASGTYKVDEIANGDLTIVGTGDTVLEVEQNSAQACGVYLASGDLKISGVVFKGETATTPNVVTGTSANGTVEIEDCEFYVTNIGVYMNPGVTGGYIKNCTFYMAEGSACAIGIDTLAGAFEISGNVFVGKGSVGYDVETFSCGTYLTATGATVKAN